MVHDTKPVKVRGKIRLAPPQAGQYSVGKEVQRVMLLQLYILGAPAGCFTELIAGLALSG